MVEVTSTHTWFMIRVIRGSKIQEVLHRLPDTKNYLYSVYNCQYGDFFQQLGKVEQFMKADRYMFTHYKYYVRSRSRPTPSCWSPTRLSN